MTHPDSASDIISRTAAEIERFVFLRDRALYRFVALWIVGTYFVTSTFDYFGYLLLDSPEAACGKTRALQVIEALCWQPSGIMADPTNAVIFHTAHSNTQLLDEIDAWREGTDLRSVLNSGFQRGGVVPRMMRDSEGNYTKIAHTPVFGPKVLAGIDKQRSLPLNAVTRSRTFGIKMSRQLPSERRERFNKAAQQSLAALKGEIEDWAALNMERVAAVYESGDFRYLDRFGDRTIDITRPFAAIVDAATPGPNARRELLSLIPLVRKEEEPDTGLAIIERLYGLAVDDHPLIGSASELAAMLRPEQSVSEYEVSEVLRGFEFTSKNVRLQGGDPRHRYRLSRSALAEVLARYVGVATCAAPMFDSDPSDVVADRLM